MACQRSMTQKREREDGMPKKHDPINKVRHKHYKKCGDL